MSILSDISLREIQPIKPFEERTKAFGMTYGCGPGGYDVRIREFIELKAGKCCLASTIEEFNMPANAMAYVKDKSTWARQFLLVQNTVIEAGWRGFLTLELSNNSEHDIAIQAGMPIAHIVFHWLDRVPSQTYNGKYQDQPRGPQAPIFET